MYKFFLVVILAFTACASEEYITDVAGQTLHDNENLLYDNYRYAVFNKKKTGMPSEDMQSETVDDALCIESCVTRPLRVAVIPMSFSHADILTEIKNTVALVQASHFLQNYNIKVLDSSNISQELLSYSPDIIIGPFTDSDLKALQKHMSETETSVPVVSLTKGKHIHQSSPMFSVADATHSSREWIYQIGYNAQDDIQSIMDNLKNDGYQNFAMFAMNDDVGASLYKDFNKTAQNNKQDILRVEFYESDLVDINKYIARLKKTIRQPYYEHTVTGRIEEDTHSFTKHIISKADNIVTLNNKQQYYKKYRTLDAIILDAGSGQLYNILERISQDDELKSIPLIATPRSSDAIIATMTDEKYSAIENTILFPSHFTLYNAYYNVYRNTFNQRPTRISSTLYEALMYTVKSNEKHDIRKGFKLTTIPVFVGLNGTLVLNKEAVRRFVNISKMQRGEITEVDTYKSSRKFF